jgi:23S rRNA (adenine2503-C2)-methyltransferase
MEKSDIKSLSVGELNAYLESIGQKKYRTAQIQDWLFKHQCSAFDQMKNLPASLVQRLDQDFDINPLTCSSQDVAEDGTIKWLFRTKDQFYIESVLLIAEDRHSICISTQVGCAMGCTFCRTAQMGFKRNLRVGEILEQFIQVNQYLKTQGKELSNIIFMGMGEPMNNFENFDRAARIFHDRRFFNLGKKRLTVSTSGLVDKIREVADRETPCHLAVSLNGTNDSMRSALMPINDRYPLEKLFEATDYYVEKTGNRITFEYILIKDITCTEQAANELIALTGRRRCKINAIVLNESENDMLVPPSDQEIEKFIAKIRSKEILIHIRRPRGRDIQAACGQLAIKQQKVA